LGGGDHGERLARCPAGIVLLAAVVGAPHKELGNPGRAWRIHTTRRCVPPQLSCWVRVFFIRKAAGTIVNASEKGCVVGSAPPRHVRYTGRWRIGGWWHRTEHKIQRKAAIARADWTKCPQHMVHPSGTEPNCPVQTPHSLLAKRRTKQTRRRLSCFLTDLCRFFRFFSDFGSDRVDLARLNGSWTGFGEG
jgi:hypothetical protein